MKLFGFQVGGPLAAVRSAPPAKHGGPAAVASEGASTGNREVERANSVLRPVVENLFVPASVVAKLAADGEIVSKDELATLRQLQTEYDRAQIFLREHIAADAKKRFAEQQARIAQEVRAGEGDKVSAQDSWTLADFQTDWQTKRAALKGQCRQIAAVAQPIAEAVAVRLGERAALAAEKIEATERETAQAWGLDHQPSKLVRILRYCAAHPRELAPAAGSQPPRHALVFAGIEF